MSESAPLRRSTRARKAPEVFENTIYAIDILQAHLNNADTDEDFMSTLFLYYKPACHRPDLWSTRQRTEHRTMYAAVSRKCASLGFDADTMLHFANQFCQGELEMEKFDAFLKGSLLASGATFNIGEFFKTVGIHDDDEDEEEQLSEGDEDEEEDGDEPETEMDEELPDNDDDSYHPDEEEEEDDDVDDEEEVDDDEEEEDGEVDDEDEEE